MGLERGIDRREGVAALIKRRFCGVVRSENERTGFGGEVVFLSLSFQSKPRHRAIGPWTFAQPCRLRCVARKLQIDWRAI